MPSTAQFTASAARPTAKWVLMSAAVSGLLVVMLGAFAAHALGDRLPQSALQTFDTALQYQMFHTAVLCFVGGMLCLPELPATVCLGLKRAAIGFLAGLILFSGSLYVMALSHLFFETVWRPLAMLTPIGGGAFIVAWLCLLLTVWRIGRQGPRPV